MNIEVFEGNNHYLSNMYRLENGLVVAPEGIVVPTVEHAYQAAKFEASDVRLAVLTATTGHYAKKTAHTFVRYKAAIIQDWPDKKIAIMRGFVREKFERNDDLRGKLVSTGEVEIVEGNDWGDRFWGVTPPGSNKGQNWLGKILMELRTDFIQESYNEQRQ